MPIISAQQGLRDLLQKNPGLAGQKVRVEARGLQAEEAIGSPQRRDFPLLQGKERLVQAEVEGARGQAFTADPLNFSGTLGEVAGMQVQRPGHQAIIIATLNALAVRLGLADRSVHCLNEEPEECAHSIAAFIQETYGAVKVGIIGYQPAILEHCVQQFGAERVAITDLNPDNIGSLRYGVEVWDGSRQTGELIQFAEVILITGTVLVNETFADLEPLLKDKPFYFYGTTAAGLAVLNNFQRLCYKGC